MRSLLFILLSLICLLATAQCKHSHAAIAELETPAEYDNVHVQKLCSDQHSSTFIIWVKKTVPLHKHAHHSESVYILEGKGSMRLGDEEFTVRKGDYLFIPEGTPHSVQVLSRKPMKVISIQSPEFVGKDRIMLD